MGKSGKRGASGPTMWSSLLGVGISGSPPCVWRCHEPCPLSLVRLYLLVDAHHSRFQLPSPFLASWSRTAKPIIPFPAFFVAKFCVRVLPLGMNWKIRAGKWHDQVCAGEGQILHPKTEVWGEQRKERKEKEARETHTGRRRKKEGGRKRKGGRIKEEGREGRRKAVSVSDLIVFSLPTDGGGEEAGNMGPSWKCPSSSFSTLRVSPLPILLSKIRSGCREKLKWLGGEAPGSHTSLLVLASLSLLWSLSGPSCWSLRQASLVSTPGIRPAVATQVHSLTQPPPPGSRTFRPSCLDLGALPALGFLCPLLPPTCHEWEPEASLCQDKLCCSQGCAQGMEKKPSLSCGFLHSCLEVSGRGGSGWA